MRADFFVPHFSVYPLVRGLQPSQLAGTLRLHTPQTGQPVSFTHERHHKHLHGPQSEGQRAWNVQTSHAAALNRAGIRWLKPPQGPRRRDEHRGVRWLILALKRHRSAPSACRPCSLPYLCSSRLCGSFGFSHCIVPAQRTRKPVFTIDQPQDSMSQ